MGKQRNTYTVGGCITEFSVLVLGEWVFVQGNLLGCVGVGNVWAGM